MSLNDARINLFNYLNTNWTSSDIIFDGDLSGDTYLKQSDPWLYAEIDWNEQVPRTLGNVSNVNFSTLGILSFKLFVQKTDGLAVLDTLTDSLQSLLRYRKISNCVITKLDIIHTENFEKWRIRHISAPFELQTIETVS